MTLTLDQQAQSIEQERRRIGRLLDEVAKLCESDIPPTSFYGEMLKRLLDALAAPAGAVYLRSQQTGILQILYQVNLAAVKIANVVLGWPMLRTLATCAALIVAFAATSGLWGVMVTDLILFAVAMTGSFARRPAMAPARYR